MILTRRYVVYRLPFLESFPLFLSLTQRGLRKSLLGDNCGGKRERERGRNGSLLFFWVVPPPPPFEGGVISCRRCVGGGGIRHGIKHCVLYRTSALREILSVRKALKRKVGKSHALEKMRKEKRSSRFDALLLPPLVCVCGFALGGKKRRGRRKRRRKKSNGLDFQAKHLYCSFHTCIRWDASSARRADDLLFSVPILFSHFPSSSAALSRLLGFFFPSVPNKAIQEEEKQTPFLLPPPPLPD